MGNTILTFNNALSILKGFRANKKHIFKRFIYVLITHYNMFKD